jgi:thioredoxin-like negative regulator of GroEL
MSRLISLDPSTLTATLARRPSGLLVLFSTTWCAPCRTYKPIVERVVAESGGALELLLVDADASSALSIQFGIRSIPTLLCFSDGEAVLQRPGSMRESQLRALLDDVGLTRQSAPASARRPGPTPACELE